MKIQINRLIEKWKNTGLLDGIHSDIEKANISALLENQVAHRSSHKSKKNASIVIDNIKSLLTDALHKQ